MKKLSAILGIILTAVSLYGCGAEKGDQKGQESTPPSTTESTQEESSVPEQQPGLEPGTVFDSVADFNYEEGQSGPWQYYFSGDNGETFDPCTTYDDYAESNVKGWHPWTGSYIGVGLNSDMEGYLELNTDGVSKDWSNQMGVLAFQAPAAGKYVITGKVWNPWSQACDLFTFKKADGTEVLTMDMTQATATFAYITPTDVELAEGDMLYMYCNSTDSSWVSAYIACNMVYEPTDDSVYEVPDVPAPEAGLVPDFEQEAQFNAYKQYDREKADGSNVPWVYASTTDGKTFTEAAEYKETDYDAQEWFTADGTGIGQVGYLEGEYLELNTPGSGAEITALGFKAPEDGTYAFNGYVYNPYGQTCDVFHASLNGEDAAAIETATYTTAPGEYSFEAEMKKGEIIYFYCPSTTEGGWVSAYISVFVNAQ